ncbi:16S rRNA m(7)G-527 methyltransferase [Anaerobacterium chartisolvens]|uniref:Ribosomal RNA small subunit methyltransferase G n=1 Tax=Anaerobacterium chartisolvens TaxID=1297424 RepID=A0A369B3J7_9FIRM|nr:16S rRNA (guanine(527)-N(7))-methyltransferase RsmG [Anaerobacterium chartisolvens]RCX16142.1 16S rRNA m(7)G-527 methyltransferase [Anaerobacterium chartisolvens]
MTLEEILINGAKEYGISLNCIQVQKFFKYKDVLIEWNKKINLTAIEEDKDVIIKHYIDSLSIISHLENISLNLIDIGTGAGFPGIPLKIACSSLNIVLLDSLEKRVKFLNQAVNDLELKGITAVHGRAEDFGLKKEYREKFDVAVARAVASLPVLLEYCMPFIKTGGRFIAMKGSSIEELGASEKALRVLGGEIEKIESITLPFSDIKRNIVLIKKLRQTPTTYPRKAGKPSKEPLI